MTDDPRDPLEDRLRAEANQAGCGYHRDLYREAADEWQAADADPGPGLQVTPGAVARYPTVADDPRRDLALLAVHDAWKSRPGGMKERAEQAVTAILATLDAADPSWRSQGVYRHALTEAINDLAVLTTSMQHPAAKRALHRARELLRHRRDGTTPAGRTDIDDDAARESGL